MLLMVTSLMFFFFITRYLYQLIRKAFMKTNHENRNTTTYYEHYIRLVDPFWVLLNWAEKYIFYDDVHPMD